MEVDQESSQSETVSSSGSGPEVELDELQVLRTVHVSLKALLQMISAVHKDLRSMSDNYKQLSDVNAKWDVLLEGHKAEVASKS